MKKLFILSFAMASVIGISTGNPFDDESNGNVAYASNRLMNAGELDNNPNAAIKGNTEKFKAEFAYEMAQITARIVSAPSINGENFKAEFAYATAKVTAKVMPIIPSSQRNEFAYEMAQITTKIISDQKLDIEKAKAEFAYEIARLTTKVITNADQIVTGNRTMLQVHNNYIDAKSVDKVGNTSALLRNNADIEITPKANKKTDSEQKIIANPGYIAPETYTGLIDELKHVGDRSSHADKKVNIDGEIRYHFALNSGSEDWNKDSSGFRAYLGADAAINKNWRVYGLLEGQANVINYNNEFKLSRLYVEGKIGNTAMLRAGSFGYLMAEGNIYDSGFKGVQVEFGDALKYTVGLGETEDTKETYIATARYNDYDYNLEAGIYRYLMNDGVNTKNTIRTLGGNYNFSNFGVGAMYLGSSQKDSNGNSNGYVFSFKYGDLKTYRPHTYGMFAKYYNQPLGTYIAHGMNGVGSRMQGFKGYGLGMNYTLAENLVAGLEYYALTDKISGEKGETLWSQITHYF